MLEKRRVRGILTRTSISVASAVAFVLAVPSMGFASQPLQLQLKSAGQFFAPSTQMALPSGKTFSWAPLMLPADKALKAQANAQYEAAAATGKLTANTAAEQEPAGGPGTPLLPTISGGHAFAGQNDSQVTPPDSTGAIGITRYIQTVNTKYAIYSRTSGTPISSGSLAALGGLPSGEFVTDPQVIWDPSTKRFYYTFLVINDPVFLSDNYLAIGFSKSHSPNTATDWCQYFLSTGTALFDYPKLGDTGSTTGFMVIGVNNFDGPSGSFTGADVLAISKPASGTTCPDPSTFSVGYQPGLKDTGGGTVLTPVPANQIDTSSVGYIVARNGDLPSNKLWIFKVTRSSAGAAVIDAVGKPLTVSTYTVPPNATQKGATQKLDTLDARNTQAILARNPLRGNSFSLYTQHTILNNGVSAVRYYEIYPGSSPAIRRTGTIKSTGTFYYNAAISPDRRSDNGTYQFGSSFVIGYNASSSTNNISPRILMKSAVNGGSLSGTVTVRYGVGPYIDFACPNAGDTCRWGDYSGAAPDPRPGTTGTGAVWLTNQYSGVKNPSTTIANWRTWVWAARP